MTAVGCGTVEVNPPQHPTKQREKCGLTPVGIRKPKRSEVLQAPAIDDAPRHRNSGDAGLAGGFFMHLHAMPAREIKAME
jgi:hypothetical protein